MSNNKKVKNIVFCAIFVVLIIAGTFIKIPIPVLPFTLQFLFTTLAGALLGSKNGALSVLCYTIIGLLGIPVFTTGGGIGYFLQPTFGYILGFIFGTFATGKVLELQKNPKFFNMVIANFIGLSIVYFIGMAYYYIICNYVINSPIALWPLFWYCFVLAIPGDILLCFVAAILTKKLKPMILKYF